MGEAGPTGERGGPIVPRAALIEGIGGERVANLVTALNALVKQAAAVPERKTYGLTPRELEVVTCIVEGCSNKDVAKQFIHGAVLRENLADSWADSTKAVHGGLTRAQWMTGTIPVSPFPAAAFGGITYKVEHSRERSVLLLVSIGSIQAGVRFQEFFIEMVPSSGGAWKVNYFGPRGTAPPVPANR